MPYDLSLRSVQLSCLYSLFSEDRIGFHLQDYVVEHWTEVSASQEFEQCCQEIASGEWGVQGGKTLTGLFRRLRSPATISDARN
jgi:hypothetical protein